MSDYLNVYKKADSENIVAQNTEALTQGALGANAGEAVRRAYTARQPLSVPRTFTAPRQGAATVRAAGSAENGGGAAGGQENGRARTVLPTSAEAADLLSVRAKNAENYQTQLPPWEYEVLNGHFKDVARTDGLKAAEEEKWRYMNALQYRRMYGIPLDDALENLDAYNRALFGADDGGASYKTKMERLGDAWTQGLNTVKRSRYGNDLIAAEQRGDTEAARVIWDAINALDKENELLAPSQPQGIGMTILTTGLQSLPYTAYAGTAGFLGGMVGVGPLAGFAAGYHLMRADSYINLRQAGADEETARGVSAVSGALQAAVEQSLGVIAHGAAHGASVAGRKLLNPLLKDGERVLADKVVKLAYSHFKMGGMASRMAASYAIQHIMDIGEEGAEEAIQEVIDGISFHVANALSENEVEADDARTIVRNAAEAFKGGVMGALFLGVFDAAFSAGANVRDFKALREAAETIPSERMFREATKDNAAFDGMSDEKKAELQGEIFKGASEARTAEAEKELSEVRATTDVSAGAEAVKTDEKGNRVLPDKEARDEGGRLYMQDDKNVTQEDGDEKKGRVLFGDPTRRHATSEDGNRYGYIDYTESGGTVTITQFSMGSGREYLRQEAFEQFAEKFAGKNIEWVTSHESDAKAKQAIVAQNPYGKSAGLNYFKDSDSAERLELARELRTLMPNVTDEMRPYAVVLAEAAARTSASSLSEWARENLVDGKTLFTDRFINEDFAREAQAAQREGKTIYGAAQFTKDLKTAIYVSEHGDFNTLSHELWHMAERSLGAEDRARATDLMKQVYQGMGKDWNGWDDEAREIFADTGVDVLRTGKSPVKGFEDIFRKFAEFIARVFRGFQAAAQPFVSDEIIRGYNDLLNIDGNMLKDAQEAVARERSERAARARDELIKRRDEERMRAAFREKKETTHEHVAKKAAEIADSVIDDLTASAQEKAVAALDAAAMASYDTDTIALGDVVFQSGSEADRQLGAVRAQYEGTDNPSILFQLAGEPSIRRMAEGEEKERLLSDLDAARVMEKKFASLDDGARAARIRYATGWERSADGRWKYELDDSLTRIKARGVLADALRDRPEQLARLTAENVLTLGDLLDAPELFKVFPFMKAVRLSFYSDPNPFRAVLTPDGIKVNVRYLMGTDGEKGLKGVLAHEMQHVIQAVEYADSTGVQGKDIERLYGDMMDAMRAAGARRYDYDTDSLQKGLDGYMRDAGEIEARNVARRVMMGASQRRHTTLESTEDAARSYRSYVLFQIAGEIGAQNLDRSAPESEGLSRMENLAVAKNMETSGKDAEAIRFATGWEKGVDGKWRYEIEDAPLHADSGLRLSGNTMDGRLSELLDAPELYAAYPELKDYLVFAFSGNGVEGFFNGDKKQIGIKEKYLQYVSGESDAARAERLELDIEYNTTGDAARREELFYELEPRRTRAQEKGFYSLTDTGRSVLLHEVQHAIQHIEGFAAGGKEGQFATISVADIEDEIRRLEKAGGDNRARIAELRGRIDEIEENALEGQVELPDGRLYEDTFAAYRSLAGEVEARNVQARMGLTGSERARLVLSLTEDVERENQIVMQGAQRMLFQTAYHGSAASFDRFDTERYGLSGEGSMFFGWGTYLTDSEDIAQDYAIRGTARETKEYSQPELYNEYGLQWNSVDYTMLSYLEIGDDYIEKDESKAPDYILRINGRVRKHFERDTDIDDYIVKKYKIDTENKWLNKRNFYTVTIPDGGYLRWKEPASGMDAERITERLYKHLLETDSESYQGNAAKFLHKELQSAFSRGASGEQIYGTIAYYVGGEKEASQFLHSIGYIGISYPAGTIYGNGNDATNYVIFDDNDIEITGHVLFQAVEGTDTKIDEVIAAADGGNNVRVQNNYGTVTPLFSDNARKHGLDIAGYSHSVDNYFVNHALKKHGDAEKETQRGQVAITRDDIRRLPEIVNNPDYIVYGSKNRQKNDVLIYAKNENDNSTLFVEEVRKGRKTLAADTMYRLTGTRDANTLMRTPSLNARNDTGTVKIVDVKHEIVNRNAAGNINSVSGDDGLLFQTEKDLLSEAAQFDSWEAWKEYQEETGGWLSDGEESAVPDGADDAWYRTAWEKARKISAGEELTDENIGKVTGETGAADETEKDRQWYAMMEQDGALDEFLRVLGEDWLRLPEAPADIDEYNEAERRRLLRDRLDKELRHASWSTAALLAHQADENGMVDLRPRHRKQLMTLMRNAKRDYRDIWAAVMQSDEWRVGKGNSTAEQIAVRIQSPVEATIALTPEERRAVAERLDFEDLKKEVRDGTLEMDMENIQKLVDGYEGDIKRLEERIEKVKAHGEENEILLVKKNAELEKLMYELKAKQEAKKVAEGVRDIKIRLIKNANRKVSFKSVHYDEGKKILAVQQLFQPLLKPYVSQFINSEGPYLRDAYSRYKTDYGYRARLKMLADAAPMKNAAKVVSLFENKTFDKWTEDDRLMVAASLPRTDWVQALNLDALEEAAKGSLQIDLQSEETQALLRDALPPELLTLLSQKKLKSWTLEQMESLVAVINDLFKEGREKLAAKREADRNRCDELRRQIEKAARTSGIVINDDDTPEEKERKQKMIDRFNKKTLPKILGLDAGIKGTMAGNKKPMLFFNRVLNGYGAMNIRRISRMLDNGKEGVNTTLLYYREDECFNAEKRAIKKQENMLRRVMRDTGLTMDDLYKTVEVSFDNTVLVPDATGAMREVQFEAKPRTVRFTVDELLYAKAASKNELSYKAVAGGNLFDETVKQRFRTTDPAAFEEMAKARMGTLLSAADDVLNGVDKETGKDTGEKFRVLLTAIERAYDEQGKRLNETGIRVYNQPVWIEEHYVPINRLEANGDTNEAKLKDEILAASVGTGSAGSWIQRGMMKKRAEISYVNQKPVRMGLVSTWTDSVADTEHVIAYSELVRDLNRIYRGRDSAATRQYIENRYGKDMNAYIDQYIKEVANPNAFNNPKSDLDRLVRALRGKTAPAYLAWKMSGIIKQFCTSPWPYMQFMSPLRYARAALQCMKPEVQAAIRANSAYMNSRVFDPLIDLVNEQKQKATDKVSHALTSFQTMGMQGLEWVDWVCVAPGWLATFQDESARLSDPKAQDALVEAKRKELKQYEDANGAEWVDAEAEKARLTPAEIRRLATRKADDVVRMAQPSSRMADLSPIFKESNELTKAFLQFTTSLNVIWQNIRSDLPQAVRDREWRKAIGMVTGYVLAGVAVGLVSEGFDDDEDDKAKKAARFAYWSMTQFTDAVPVIGSVVTRTAEGAITGKWQYGSAFSSLLPVVDKGVNAVRYANKGAWDKALTNFGEAVGLSLGLPVSGAKEALYVAGLGDGEEGVGFHPTALAGRRPK